MTANCDGTMVDFVITTGFKSSKSDRCIYIYHSATMKRPTFATWSENAVILTFYVVDVLPVGQNKLMLSSWRRSCCIDSKRSVWAVSYTHLTLPTILLV